jgi:hypothetical protein
MFYIQTKLDAFSFLGYEAMSSQLILISLLPPSLVAPEQTKACSIGNSCAKQQRAENALGRLVICMGDLSVLARAVI